MAAIKSPTATPGSGEDLIVGSASTSGMLIAVAATASPGTTLHTVPAKGGSGLQRIVIWACNVDTVTRTLTIQWGGTATKDKCIVQLGAKRGMVPIISDFKLGQGLIVKAFADAANVINCYVSVGDLTKGPSSSAAAGP